MHIPAILSDYYYLWHQDTTMMKLRFLSISLSMLLCGCSLTHNVDVTKLELPAIQDDDYLVEYIGYISSYNMLLKTPEWVAYELTSEEMKGPAQRSGKYFTADDSVLLPQPDDDDYRGSGWTRGHLAPAADFRWSDEAMQETFLFTNCCPQDEELNGGLWNSLEMKCRNLAKRYGNIYIVTGPITGKNTYGTIGDSRVVVPDAFFKALLVNTGSEWHSAAFIMQNNGSDRSLKKCSLTVDELEELIDLDLFPALKDTIENAVERRLIHSFWKL